MEAMTVLQFWCKKQERKMTMKKLKWFKRVISGALAVAVCATSLFGGVDFGGLIGYASPVGYERA